MINKKICMVGAFAVGKTSLVKQYVECIYDEKYHTTIGVKIDKKTVKNKDEIIQLMIWDIEGVDGFTDLKPSYLRGASGIVLVVDGTRKKTLEPAEKILKMVKKNLSDVPVLLLINKSDLVSTWQITLTDSLSLGVDKNNTFQTSAKENENVELAFKRMIELVIK